MDEVTTPGPGNPVARFDRLGSVLASVTFVVGFVAVLGGSEAIRRGNILVLLIALASLTGGIGLLIAFRDRGNASTRLRRLRSGIVLALLSISLVCFVLLVSRSQESDHRPVINVVATGVGPLTLSGQVTASGLAATERVSVKIVDQGAIPFQGVTGPDAFSGRAAIPFDVHVNGRPDRDVTIVAWLTDRVTGEPTCSDAATSLPDVACVHLALQSGTLAPPVLTLSPDLQPGARSVTVAVTGVIGPTDGVQVNLWDRDALIGSFIAHPDLDGTVSSSNVVPLHDDRAVLCAVAEVVGVPAPKAVPSPCVATTFAQLIVPPVPRASAVAAP